MSKKRTSQIREYNKLRKQFLLDNPYCGAGLECCTSVATEIHHMAGRENNRLLDTNSFLAICRNCHTYITENSKEAISLGLSKSRLK